MMMLVGGRSMLATAFELRGPDMTGDAEDLEVLAARELQYRSAVPSAIVSSATCPLNMRASRIFIDLSAFAIVIVVCLWLLFVISR